MDVFVARQPIFDRLRRTYAYELLFRSGPVDSFDGQSPDPASIQVIDRAFFLLGIEAITGGKPAFVNFTRDTLVRGLGALVAKELIVVEILESVRLDLEVLAACRALKRAGHTIALDDVILGEWEAQILTFADIVKVDFLRNGPAARAQVVRALRPRGLTLLAEKVESQHEFAEALRAGYHYFQGYFFEKPVLIASRDVPATKLGLLALLREIHRPEADLARVSEIIRREVGLTLRLLTYLNSAAFGFRRRIESIRHALTLLGEAGVRRWASVAILADLGRDQPFELVVSSVVRAKLCESLAAAASVADRAADGFLVGLFSRLDTLLGRPLPDVLEGLPVTAEVRVALLGGQCPLGLVLALARAWERGDWREAIALSQALGLTPGRVGELYREALTWGDATSSIAPRA